MMVRQRCGIMGARNGIHQSLYSIFDGKILGKSHPDTKILRDQKRRVARRGSSPDEFPLHLPPHHSLSLFCE